LEYHSGVGFTLLARRVRGELGRGGRYVSGKGEPSTGFTLYLDSLLRAVPIPDGRRRLFLPPTTSRRAAASWRKKGWITIACLEPIAEARGEARRLGCTHYLRAGRALAIKE
jgi:ATP phosphoribosyltransferase regulatory subunit